MDTFITHLGIFRYTGDEYTGYHILYPSGAQIYLPRGFALNDFIKAMSIKLK